MTTSNQEHQGNNEDIIQASTILVVDDDLKNLHMISLCLQDTGHRILVAQDGESALKRVELANPDLILMDVVMPAMDGFETCKRIKEKPKQKDIPVIFMTSLSDQQSKVTGFQAGGVDYITKPFQFEEVLARVNTHLSIVHSKRLLKERAEEMSAFNEELIALNEELSDNNEKMQNEIAERQKVEMELARTNNELTDTIKELKTMQSFLVQSEKMVALGNLVAGLAHEINTPIGVGVTASTNLTNLSRTLLKDYGPEVLELDASKSVGYVELVEDIDQSSRIIANNLGKAGKLIRNFKLVATDQSTTVKRKFYVKEYIQEILLSINPAIKQNGHEVLVNCNDAIEIESYPGVFSQVISNLVMNAIIHAFDEKHGIINIDVEGNHHHLTVQVSDNGKGIPPNHLEKIFDPFYTTKRTKGGTGLGLYIVYNIVTQQLNGSIDCKSEEGVGTKFIIELNLEEV